MAMGSKLCRREKPHLHGFPGGFVGYFSPSITMCSGLDPALMGKCLMTSARARHRFSQHNLVPMLHKRVNMVSTYSLFLRCDVLPLLPFLYFSGCIEAKEQFTIRDIRHKHRVLQD